MSLLSGATRGKGGRALSRHLLSPKKGNEVLSVIEPRGLAAQEFAEQIEELSAGAINTRTAAPIYHIHFDPVTWNETVRTAFWSRFESEFDLSGARFCGVMHRKNDRVHEHRVYDLTADDGVVTSLRFDYLRREKVAVVVAHEFGLPAPPIKHARAVAAQLIAEGHGDAAEFLRSELNRPVRIASRTPVERAIEERKSTSKATVADQINAAWKSSDSGAAFVNALKDRGLTLASGDKVVVVVDKSGAAWPLARLLGGATRMDGKRVKAAEVKRRLIGVEILSIERVRHDRRDNIEKADHFSITNSNIDPGVPGESAVASGSWSQTYGGDRDHQSGRSRDSQPREGDSTSVKAGGAGGGGTESGPDSTRSDHPYAETSDDGHRNGRAATRVHQRSSRNVRATIEVVRATQSGRAKGIMSLARQVMADTLLGANGRALREIGHRENDARRRLDAVNRHIDDCSVMLPQKRPAPELVSGIMLGTPGREPARVVVTPNSPCRGLWSWLEGKVQKYHRLVQHLSDEQARISNALRSAIIAFQRSRRGGYDGEQRVNVALNRDADRAATRAAIEAELAWLVDARTCSEKNPSLAHASSLVLTEAVDKLRGERERRRLAEQPKLIRVTRAQPPTYSPR